VPWSLATTCFAKAATWETEASNIFASEALQPDPTKWSSSIGHQLLTSETATLLPDA
jgi:hypothetical protein